LLEELLWADMSMASARRPTAAEHTFDLKSEENADAFESKSAKLEITATASQGNLGAPATSPKNF
jgi:hypothetical protein